MELTSTQRKALSAQAHELKPVVIIGQAGVTDGVMGKIAESLKAHELIKIKFNEYNGYKSIIYRFMKQDFVIQKSIAEYT